MIKPRWFLPDYRTPMLLLLAVLVSCGLILTGAPQPFHVAAALWLVAFSPGFAMVRLLKYNDWVTNLTLSIALSLALATCVALIMIYTHTWSLISGLFSLAAIALVASALELRFVRTLHALPEKLDEEAEL